MGNASAKPGVLRRAGNAVDALIGVVSPAKAIRNRRIRNLEEATFPQTRYDGALLSTLTEWWQTGGESADDALLPELPVLRQRSRDLCRNNPVAKSIIDTLIRSVVGTGLRPLPAVDWKMLGIERESARAVMHRMRANFKAHSKCMDFEDRLHYYQMQRLSYRQELESGESLMIRRYVDPKERPWAKYGTCWQQVEPDCLMSPPDLRSDKSVRDGIEMGTRGQPVAYWISKHHPGDSRGYRMLRQDDFQRIPAFDAQGRPLVLHRYHKLRPNQSRGVPVLAAMIEVILGLKKGFNNEMIAMLVSSCLAYVIENSQPLGGLDSSYDLAQDTKRDGTSTAKIIGKAEPGMIFEAEPGQTVKAHMPNRPSSNLKDWLMFGSRWAGAPAGVPVEKFMLDYSGTTYTSGRMNELSFWSVIDVIQQDFEFGLPAAAWAMSIEEQVLRGHLPALKDYHRDRDPWHEVVFIEPARPWVDPVKDATGRGLMLDRDMTTLAAECEGLGVDWEETLEQRHEERLRQLERRAELKTRAEELGLTDTTETDPNTGTDNTQSTQDRANAILAADEEV